MQIVADIQEMRAKLEPAEDGLFRLKAAVAAAVQEQVPSACRGAMRFLLAGKLSNIYRRHGAVRKVHNVVYTGVIKLFAGDRSAAHHETKQ
jgi:DNA helicase-2/ATP-dependent DNA helicase PcrA